MRRLVLNTAVSPVLRAAPAYVVAVQESKKSRGNNKK